MHLPDDIADVVAPLLGGAIVRAAAVGGGCIAHATRVETEKGIFFLKYGRGAVAETFAAEAAGLRALKAAHSDLFIPEVIATENEKPEHPGFLVLEWVETGTQSGAVWDSFGQGLAGLHRHSRTRYGFERDNYIGRLPQQNTWEETWIDFFRDHRLAPQVQRARAAGRWQSSWNAALNTLYQRLGELLPGDPPASMLHGDLWSGNYMVTKNGRPALIDPAAYYGHREADLAMTELFGGFAPRFYDAYRAAWPLDPGYDRRRDIYNLYHLINHLNHFGSSYAGSVASVLKPFA